MKAEDIIRIWKNKDSISIFDLDEQLSMPDNPAGYIEIDIENTDFVAGAADPTIGGTCYTACAPICTLNNTICGGTWRIFSF